MLAMIKKSTSWACYDKQASLLLAMIKGSFLFRGQPTGISQPAASGRDGRLQSTLQVSDPILHHIQSPVKARSGAMSYDAKRKMS